MSDPDPRLAALRRLAIVPAYNEEGSVARVIDEIRAFDPGFEVVVVDDGSGDRTTEVAEEMGARVLTLPYNLGIGGSVQTAFRYALENDFELAVRLDGDGQHDAAHLPALVAPVLDGEADVAVGSRYLADGGYKQSAHRNIGNRILAGAASLVARQHVTDPSSGFQALNRDAIELFARDYPHEFPEVEATVLVAKHRLRRVEVPAPMRERLAGSSSHGVLKSTYFLAKVLVALFVAMFRRNAVPGGDAVTPLTFSIAGAVASVLLVLVVLELIRKRRLKERYALLWLVTGIVLLVLSLWRSATATIADWFGVETYPPAVLFAVAVFFILLVLLDYSTAISKLVDQNVTLAQRLAILEEKVKERDKA